MSIALVLGSGGHTSELLKIVANLPENISAPSKHLLIYSSDDSLSISQYKSKFNNSKTAAAEIVQIPRARRVGQSYFTSIFTTIYSLIACLLLFIRFNPKIVQIFL